MLFKHISKGRNCPECNSAEVFRVKRTGMALKLICNVTNLRPHWCSNCDTFFLAPRQERATRVRSDAPVADGKPNKSKTTTAGQEHLAH
ncbi:MAG TPA: hypothetical protein VMH31_09340 [Methylomirabilota bacterium]|nr:hypothetical protein [Methylomirabilota bacterium]